MASFLYVFIVCGAAAGAGIGASVSSVLLTTSLASGLAIAVLTHCFLHVSGKKFSNLLFGSFFSGKSINDIHMLGIIFMIQPHKIFFRPKKKIILKNIFILLYRRTYKPCCDFGMFCDSTHFTSANYNVYCCPTWRWYCWSCFALWVS